MEKLARKVVDKMLECEKNNFDIGETIIESCEVVKDDIDEIKKNRSEFFCSLWEQEDEMNEYELNVLAAIEATIVMMCGGKL